MNLFIFHIDLGARHVCRGDHVIGSTEGSMRDQLEVPCVVFDYGFFGGEGDEETLAVQIAKDVGNKMLFAHVVPKKGVMLMKDIDRLGHKKLCLKSDGEPALVAIQEEVRKQRIDEMLLEIRLWETASHLESLNVLCKVWLNRSGC